MNCTSPFCTESANLSSNTCCSVSHYTVKFRQTINKVNEAERLGECGFRKGLNKRGKARTMLSVDCYQDVGKLQREI